VEAAAAEAAEAAIAEKPRSPVITTSEPIDRNMEGETEKGAATPKNIDCDMSETKEEVPTTESRAEEVDPRENRAEEVFPRDRGDYTVL
jgi:hypothetical protein